MISSDMTSKDHVAISEESSLCTKLASDVASNAGLHVGLTISGHIKHQITKCK